MFLNFLMLIGTRGYWAPEVIKRDENGHRCRYNVTADYFSLGVIIYEFIVGVNPFRAIPITVIPSTPDIEPDPDTPTYNQPNQPIVPVIMNINQYNNNNNNTCQTSPHRIKTSARSSARPGCYSGRVSARRVCPSVSVIEGVAGLINNKGGGVYNDESNTNINTNINGNNTGRIIRSSFTSPMKIPPSVPPISPPFERLSAHVSVPAVPVHTSLSQPTDHVPVSYTTIPTTIPIPTFPIHLDVVTQQPTRTHPILQLVPATTATTTAAAAATTAAAPVAHGMDTHHTARTAIDTTPPSAFNSQKNPNQGGVGGTSLQKSPTPLLDYFNIRHHRNPNSVSLIVSARPNQHNINGCHTNGFNTNNYYNDNTAPMTARSSRKFRRGEELDEV